MTTTFVKEFPVLYKINSNHKISEWSIKIEPKEDSTSYYIITSHGDKDGKKIIHSTEIEKGKVKRSVFEQADLEATRKWKNKKEKEVYTEDLHSLLIPSSSSEVEHQVENEVELKLNTKSKSEKKIELTKESINVRPMLANTFSYDLYKSNSRAFKIKLPSYVQRKYDGIRCIAYLKDGNPILESRKGIPFQNFELLKSQLKEILDKLPDNFYFDGELYTEKIPFETVSGLIRLSNKKCTIEDKAKINVIEYHIYDCIDLNQKDQLYKDRYSFLHHLFQQKNMSKYTLCKDVLTYTVENLEEIKQYHDQFVQEGFEGLMLRDMNGIYEINKRSKYLQKVKEFMEEEFEIVGFHEGTGDEKGAIIWDCITNDKKTFAVRPKGTFESRKELFEKGTEYIGKQLTVIFQEYSKDGVPRFGVGKAIRDIY
jgi:ATP-dependent DNA ligase